MNNATIKKVNLVECTIPVHFLAYLINDDPTNLSDREIELFDRYVYEVTGSTKRHFKDELELTETKYEKIQCHFAAPNLEATAHFCKYHDLDYLGVLGCDCIEVPLVVIIE